MNETEGKRGKHLRGINKRVCSVCGAGPFSSRLGRHKHYIDVHCEEGMSKRKRRDTKGHVSLSARKKAIAQAA